MNMLYAVFYLLCLNKLYEKHMNFYSYEKFKLTKYTSLKKNYSSRYVFFFSKNLVYDYFSL